MHTEPNNPSESLIAPLFLSPKQKRAAANNHKFLEEMPGICGEIARYLHSAMQWDQPAIAMGAVLSMMGALKSKRFKNKYNIAPCLYVCTVADSGTGKSTCQEIIEQLLNEIDADPILVGKPASDVALIHAMEAQNGRRYLIWDEFGKAMAALSGSKNTHEAQILDVMMDMFSSANKIYRAKAYAKSNSNPPSNINMPHLSVFGASTPNRFFGALSEDFVDDGFLTRILFFMGESKVKGKTPYRNVFSPEILEDLKKINEGNRNPSGDGRIELLEPVIETIKMTPEAEEFLDSLIEQCKAEYFKCEDKILKVFLTRQFEHTVKVATILTEDTILDLATVIYAKKLTEFLVEGAAAACNKHLFYNVIQRDESKVRDKILALFPAVGSKVTKSVISNKLQRYGKTRVLALADLVECEILSMQADQDPYNEDPSRKKACVYTRIQ